MEELFRQMMTMLEEQGDLQPLPIADDLRQIRRPLGMINLNMYNWEMEKVRKISVMRATMRIPTLEIFALEIYPAGDYDLPLLAIDFSCMKKKTFVYLNFIPLASTESYHKKYIEILKPIYIKYHYSGKKTPRPWMIPYMTPYTVYVMAENMLLADLKHEALEYLSVYLELLSQAESIDQEDYRQEITRVCTCYLDQLSTKDQSRKMLGRLIGRSRADRIFMEVIR